MFRKRRIYLDSAAGVSGNPSSPHTEGRQAHTILEEARTTIARLLEVQSDDLIFTSGATESNALAILGSVRARRTTELTHPHVLYLPSAHASIVENVKQLEREGIRTEELPIKDYRVDIGALAKLVKEDTVLVTMDAVCGETGVVWNTREVAEVLKNRDRCKPLLHIDASQAPLTEKITRAHFAADLLTLDGAKVSPLHGSGLLVAHRTIPLTALYYGGGQERGLRPGSEAYEAIHSFAQGLTKATQGREAFRARASTMRMRLLERIRDAFPDAMVQEGHLQAPNILNLSLPGRDTDYLVALLDTAGFSIATRSACETDSESGSRAVWALTNDILRARSTIRVSWGADISWRDLRRFSDAFVRAVHFIDSNRVG